MGRNMLQDDDYLAMAVQADKAALTASSPVARNTWRAMAEEYRKLAASHLDRSQQKQETKSPF